MFPNIIIQSDFAEVNGTRLYYELAGEGELPLVLIHAGIADCRMWDAQFASLAQQARLLRYDMRGYGQSHPKIGEFSHTEDLLSLLDNLKIEHAVLVGCSKGGTTAIDLALAHPERVAGLVLVCAAPTGFEFTGEPPHQWDEMVTAFKRCDFWRAAELDVQMWVVGPQRKPEQVPQAIRQAVCEMDLTALANEANGLGVEKWLESQATVHIATLSAPTLVILGELDDPNLVRAGHWMSEQIPGAQVFSFATCAHLPNMEQPEIFNQQLLAFLSFLRSEFS